METKEKEKEKSMPIRTATKRNKLLYNHLSTSSSVAAHKTSWYSHSHSSHIWYLPVHNTIQISEISHHCDNNWSQKRTCPSHIDTVAHNMRMFEQSYFTGRNQENVAITQNQILNLTQRRDTVNLLTSSNTNYITQIYKYVTEIYQMNSSKLSNSIARHSQSL